MGKSSQLKTGERCLPAARLQPSQLGDPRASRFQTRAHVRGPLGVDDSTRQLRAHLAKVGRLPIERPRDSGTFIVCAHAVPRTRFRSARNEMLHDVIAHRARIARREKDGRAPLEQPFEEPRHLVLEMSRYGETHAVELCRRLDLPLGERHLPAHPFQAPRVLFSGSESKDEEHLARSDRDVLFAVNLEGDGVRANVVASLEMPQGLPALGVEGKKFPSSVPAKTRSPAVESTPAHGGECWRNSHFVSPVEMSRARMAPTASSP